MSFSHPGSLGEDVFSPPLDSEIRDQLARVRASPAFDAPDRAQKFLFYVVEEALQGRADRIKAYSIALEVFGRNASFDAQNDPVVRIEAGRVRRALEHYYLLAGQRDPVLITIPKGGYVPAFTRFNQTASKAERQPEENRAPGLKISRRALGLVSAMVVLAVAGVWIAGKSGYLAFSELKSNGVANSVPMMPRVIVAPFEDITGVPSSALLARGLTDEVTSQMARFKEIVVIGGKSQATLPVGPAASSDLLLYGLEGRIRLDQDRLRLSARLVNRADGAIVWTKAYNAQLGQRELFDIETVIASEIATAIAQPYGVIFQANASEVVQSSSEDSKAYACTLSYYGYRAALNRQTHATVQSCLKEVVSEFPNYATAWALLSFTYLDELRFRYRLESSEPPPIDLALDAAEKAVELDPANVRALEAEMLARFFSGDITNALSIGERAFAINPNDTEFAGEYGFRLALTGQWDRGCGLISKSIERNPGPVEYFQSAMAVCSYMQEDYPGAENWARASNLHDNPIHHLILLAIYGQMGKPAQAQGEHGWLALNAPEFLEDTRKEVVTRILRAEDQEHFIDGLRKAGLDITQRNASGFENEIAQTRLSQNKELSHPGE
jgi:TolB-like protein/Tfp pilus assembly protein PilF